MTYSKTSRKYLPVSQVILNSGICYFMSSLPSIRGGFLIHVLSVQLTLGDSVKRARPLSLRKSPKGKQVFTRAATPSDAPGMHSCSLFAR